MTIEEKITWLGLARLITIKNCLAEHVGAYQEAFDQAVAALNAPQEAKSPCAACGYGGKHLEAPPCTSCPAYPKEAENNEPLTMKEIIERKGKPLWYQFQDGSGMWSLHWVMASHPLVLYLDDGKEHIDYKTPYRDWRTYDRPPKEARNV